MAGKRAPSKRKRRERNFVLISSALIVLTMAAVFALESAPYSGGAPRVAPAADSPAPAPSEQPRQDAPRTKDAPSLASETFAYFAGQRGVRVRVFDALSSPPSLQLSAGMPESEFSRLLGGFLESASCRVLSRESGPSRLRFSLGRGREAIGLTLDFETEPKLERGAPEKSAQPRASRESADRALAARTAARPSVALILDDAGGGGATQWDFLKLPVKLTFAVIPDLENSRRFAEAALAAGHELLIHLPMQPLADEKQNFGGDMLMSGMNARDIGRVLDAALASVPGAKGVNNHMGSLATSDRALMRLFMPALKARGLFFVDSYTHADSVGIEEAILAGMPGRKRDVFLDHVVESAHIEEVLGSLVQKAAERGAAIGIGHVTHPETLEVLRGRLPAYLARGVQFVGISEIH